MIERKIQSSHFDSGRFHENLAHDLHRTSFSPQGHERVTGAMKAAIEHVEQKHGLRYGVSAKHYDEMHHFLNTNYREWRELKPQERKFVTSALEKHYGIEPEKPVAANDNMRLPKAANDNVAHSTHDLPRAANDNEEPFRKAA